MRNVNEECKNIRLNNPYSLSCWWLFLSAPAVFLVVSNCLALDVVVWVMLACMRSGHSLWQDSSVGQMHALISFSDL